MAEKKFKLMVIGDMAVGKTSLLSRFTRDSFSFGTFGCLSFEIYTTELDGKEIKLQLWDLPGNERFQTLNKSYYRIATGVMLVYDITNEKSFDNIRNWIRDINEHNEDVKKIIVGNMCDLEHRRTVSNEQGEQLAKEYCAAFMETSAKDSINVKEAFFTLARDIEANVPKLKPSETSYCCLM
ncbi:hypothetical protein C0Q70_03546 [Pomacea canaliculata]|uniref:Uncharacterized protein n=2 Tax=Pomacea canaliculata TaxID=400727 RepID=A0A2T7PT12_POMCA|nr:hypothetical protein C0Q70_03546 [Pomacea canaliculata]